MPASDQSLKYFPAAQGGAGREGAWGGSECLPLGGRPVALGDVG